MADRLPRKFIMQSCDFVCAILLGCMAFSVSFEFPSWFRIGTILGTVGLQSVSMALYLPASKALVRDLIPSTHLAPANSILQAASTLATVTGLVAGGVVFNSFGPQKMYAFDSLTYILSFFLISRMTVRVSRRKSDQKRPPEHKSSPTQGGLDVIKSVPGLLFVFSICGILNFFKSMLFTLLPYFVTSLKLSSYWYGILLGGSALGLFLGGSLVLFPYWRAKTTSLVMALSLVAAATLRIVLAFTNSGSSTLLVMILESCCYGFFNIQTLSRLQNCVAQDKIGRVFGTMNALVSPLAPAGMLIAGLVVDYGRTSLKGLVFTSGLGMLGAALWGLRSKAWRHFFSLPYTHRLNEGMK